MKSSLILQGLGLVEVTLLCTRYVQFSELMAPQARETAFKIVACRFFLSQEKKKENTHTYAANTEAVGAGPRVAST